MACPACRSPQSSFHPTQPHTPPEVLTRLNRELATLLGQPEARGPLLLLQRVMAMAPQSPAQAAERLRQEIQRWAKVIDDTGIKPDQ